VVACVAASNDGRLLNVNADTLAAHIAVAIEARRLIIAGGTSVVLDELGRTITRLRARDAARLIRQGTASAGMIAKLQACRAALRGGVGDVMIVDGRNADLGRLDTAAEAPSWTQVVE
jgi:acetylglutamate kinase